MTARPTARPTARLTARPTVVLPVLSSRGQGSVPRRLLVAVLAALLGVLVTPVAAFAASPAPPGPWSSTGPGATTLSDGSRYRPLLAYGLGADGDKPSPVTTWTFSTVAQTTGRVSFPYDWVGYHGENRAKARLVTSVEGGSSTTVVDATPTGLFRYRGTLTVDAVAGRRITLSLRGSNDDRPGRLGGLLRLGDGPDAPQPPYTDAALVASNTSWTNAVELVDTLVGTLTAPGEARWYHFRVKPGEGHQTRLSELAADLDIAVYKDISQQFEAATAPTDVARLTQEFAGGDAYAPSVYSPSVYSPSVYSPTIYSPSVYSPSVYSPSVYSPSVYSPSVYSPSVYSPSVYSPSVYSPSVYSPTVESPDPAFLEAFSSAQTRSLLAVSATPGTADETLQTLSWNNTGSYYVRVQGKGPAVSSFRLSLTRTPGPCEDVALDPMTPAPSPASPTAAEALVLTDTARLGLSGAAAEAFRASLGRLGEVVDAASLPRLVALNAQADAAPSCTYAKNLVAQALREVVTSKRGDALGSVVIAGDDAVVPFFRYPDTSGLAPESQFSPPLRAGTASDASLRNDQVLGQDAYGATVDVSIKGSVLPVPDLPVGRLVETPAEITGQVDEFVRTSGRLSLGSGLVTGYDFLADAADAVIEQFDGGLRTPVDRLVTPAGALPEQGWTADDLRGALLPAGGAGSAPDLVYLAGHFSANSALAADNRTSLLTRDLAARPLALQGSLVMSAGCHSGYGVVDADGLPGGLTDGLDWAQEMARQKAVLIAGTGYQYGDTDFLEYGERLYLGIAKALRSGTAGTPVQVGRALVAAKQEYLATTGTLAGIDQKSLLEATLYGIPMTGVDLPGRLPAPPTPPRLDLTPVGTVPGSVLGLSTAALDVVPTLTARALALSDLSGAANGLSATWLEGPDGVVTAPAAPALPKQVLDVTGPDGAVLRGVGLRSGRYTDTAGVLPLTGAPATEQNGVHTTFSAPAFFPQQLVRTNHYDALGAEGTGGRTRLVVTPAQYRSEGPGSATAVQRAYTGLGLQLFSSTLTATPGAHSPVLAAPPSISDVDVRSSGQTVTVRARIAGDPTAGIQQVWTTYTAGAGAWYGRYDSLDLVQSSTDSTLWTGTLALPADVPAASARFLLQAVNGAGVVALDTASGDGYAAVPVGAPAPAPLDVRVSSPTAGTVGGTVRVAATGLPAGAPVQLGVGAAVVDTTANDAGRAQADVPLRVRPGRYAAFAAFAGSPSFRAASATGPVVDVARAVTALTVTPLPAAGPYDEPADVVLTSGGLPLAGRSVQVTVVRDGRPVVSVVRASGPDGRVPFDAPLPLGPRGTLTASFGELGTGLLPDVEYLPSTDTAALPGRVTAQVSVVSLPPVAQPGAAFSAPLVLRVADADGRPVPGVVVTAASPATGTVVTLGTPGASTATVTTGADGTASLPVTAGTVPGTAQVVLTGAHLEQATAALLVDVREQTGPLRTSILGPPLPDGSLPARASGSTPVRVQVLRADGSVLSGAEAVALADRCGIVLRARPEGAGTATGASPCLRYSALEQAFRYDATAQEFGWARGQKWTLQVFLRAVDGTAFGRSSTTLTFA